MIVFRNLGIIDIAAVTTMGVSVKNESSIGYFGTGVKFAIATILRHGGKLYLSAGLTQHVFSTEKQIIRDKEFNIVHLDGAPLGFTTDLGKNWEPWMAFRELACNALDEQGKYYNTDKVPSPTHDETIFTVDCEHIESVYFDRKKIILESDAIIKTRGLEVHNAPSEYIYYRKVRVQKLNRPSRYTYNILDKIDLTEDRTAKYTFQTNDRVAEGFSSCDDYDFLSIALNVGEQYFEHSLNFAHSGNSQAFLRVCAELRADMSNISTANGSALDIAKHKHLSNLSMGGGVKLNILQQKQYDKAISILHAAGYNIEAYPIIFVESLGKGIHGLAKEDKIFIATAAIEKGTRELAATLLEEYAHLKTGYDDESRELQNWLFDQVLCKVEHIANEPF